MGVGTLSLTGTITGYPIGQRAVNTQWVLQAAIDDSTPLNLQVGNNTLPVPIGASMLLVEMPAGNTVPVTLKGAPGDAGTVLHRTLAHWQSLDSSVSVLYLSIGAPLSGPLQVAFF